MDLMKRDMAEGGDLVEELIGRYRPLVYAMARRMCPGRPRDEDLLQCGLIGLWQAAERWDGTRPFAPLARCCIQGVMADHLRRERRQVRTVPLEGAEEALLRTDDLSAIELRDGAERLPAGSRRRALMLALADGYDLAEAARRLGVRPSRARAMARRAAREMGLWDRGVDFSSPACYTGEKPRGRGA